MAGKTDLPG